MLFKFSVRAGQKKSLDPKKAQAGGLCACVSFTYEIWDSKADSGLSKVDTISCILLIIPLAEVSFETPLAVIPASSTPAHSSEICLSKSCLAFSKGSRIAGESTNHFHAGEVSMFWLSVAFVLIAL